MYIGRHIKYPLFLSKFNETWIFSTDFTGGGTEMPDFMKICTVTAELFHFVRRDGRKDGLA